MTNHIKIDEALPDNWYNTIRFTPEHGIELFGYSKEWIDEDYTPDGIRLCFLNDEGEWIMAAWCGYHDEYHTFSTNEPFDEDMINRNPPTHWRYKMKPPKD
jgi:hypothetical protein